MSTILASSDIVSEMAVYLGTAKEIDSILHRPAKTDAELMLELTKVGFTAAEVNGNFAEAKQIAGC